MGSSVTRDPCRSLRTYLYMYSPSHLSFRTRADRALRIFHLHELILGQALPFDSIAIACDIDVNRYLKQRNPRNLPKLHWISIYSSCYTHRHANPSLHASNQLSVSTMQRYTIKLYRIIIKTSPQTNYSIIAPSASARFPQLPIAAVNSSTSPVPCS